MAYVTLRGSLTNQETMKKPQNGTEKMPSWKFSGAKKISVGNTERRKKMNLSNVPTSELVRELSRREGVEGLSVEPYQPYQIIAGDQNISDTGPIVLLMIVD